MLNAGPNRPNVSPNVSRLCIGHVDSMMFASFLFAFGTQRKRGFRWNLGFISQFYSLLILKKYMFFYVLS